VTATVAFATLAPGELASVVGGGDGQEGPNTTTTTDSSGTKRTARTNYAYCLDKVKENCRAENAG
jgi:hypothetical protein